MITDVTATAIAQICHEANRVYCAVLGDDTQATWLYAPDWQKESAIAGVKTRIENPDFTPADMHQSWLDLKTVEGWVYGPTKDADAKQHPCMVPYDDLPKEQQRKDALFSAIVGALTP